MNTFRNLAIAAALALLGAGPLGGFAAAAPPAPQLPSIVLVHGAFADGSSWDRVVPLLQAQGYRVVAVHEPLTSLVEDVAATRRAIDMQPGDVVLVGHSYGGAVITEAGNDPKVKSLVYVAAFAPDANESVNDQGRGKPAPVYASSLQIDSGGYAWLPASTVVQHFAQDLPEAEATLLAVKQGPINAKNFDEKVKVAAWHTRPAFYLRTNLDHMIDPEVQTATAKRMKATLTSISSSHVAMLSHPQEVAAVIMKAAQAIHPRTAQR
jgi:pimeloyl-ACP methyl ester carboxylesterase